MTKGTDWVIGLTWVYVRFDPFGLPIRRGSQDTRTGSPVVAAQPRCRIGIFAKLSKFPIALKIRPGSIGVQLDLDRVSPAVRAPHARCPASCAPGVSGISCRPPADRRRWNHKTADGRHPGCNHRRPHQYLSHPRAPLDFDDPLLRDEVGSGRPSAPECPRPTWTQTLDIGSSTSLVSR